MPDVLPAIPDRRGAARRDRRGRGLRGPLIPPTLPGWRTRREVLEDVLRDIVSRLERRHGAELSDVEFAVEDVPPTDPSPWERRAVAMGRYFPADRTAGLSHRIVVYRRPIQSRCSDRRELEDLLAMVVSEQVAHVLGIDPEDV